MHKATIMAVDDDSSLLAVLRHYLEREGYQFLSAQNGKELSENLDHSHVDIILLDLALPHDDSLSLFPLIRSKSKATVIIIGKKKESVDRIISLEMGADDYLTKPFALRELLAKIHAVLRRAALQDDPANESIAASLTKASCISFGGWVLDRLQYQLFSPDGKTAELTSGEFKLLDALVTAPNRVLSREQLFALTHEGNFDIFDRAIDIQIGRIRKKINDNPYEPTLIKTVRGVGYMFIGTSRAVK